MNPISQAAAHVTGHVAQIREIRERLAALDQHDSPRDVPLQRWRQMIRDSRDFIDEEYAFMALDYNWSMHQLWGCHAVKPFARLDCAGLLWLINGAAVEDLGAGYCALLTPSGARQIYHPHTWSPLTSNICLPWELT